MESDGAWTPVLADTDTSMVDSIKAISDTGIRTTLVIMSLLCSKYHQYPPVVIITFLNEGIASWWWWWVWSPNCPLVGVVSYLAKLLPYVKVKSNISLPLIHLFSPLYSVSVHPPHTTEFQFSFHIFLKDIQFASPGKSSEQITLNPWLLEHVTACILLLTAVVWTAVLVWYA